MKLKRIIFLLINVLLVNGCSAEYSVDFVNGEYKEEVKTVGNYNDESYKNEIDNFNNKDHLFVDYTLQTGDYPVESFLDEYDVYKKDIFSNKNDYGIILSHSYSNKDEYIKSSVVFNMFDSFNINEDSIYLSNTKDIFLNYPLLDSIVIKFNTDKYILESNADEIVDDKYYWYLNKDNYKDKSISIIFDTDSKILRKYKENINNYLDYYLYLFLVGALIFILVIYGKVRKSNK